MFKDVDIFRTLHEDMTADVNRLIVAWAKDNEPSIPIGDVFKLASAVSSMAASHMNTTWQESRALALNPASNTRPVEHLLP